MFSVQVQVECLCHFVCSQIDSISGNLSNASTGLGELVTAWRQADLPSEEIRSELITVTEEAQSAADNAKDQTQSISSTLAGFYDVSTIKKAIDRYDTLR